MRIYFDMCSLQRPLDDKTQLRVMVEAQAVLGVLALCESGQADIVASEALAFESDANPDAVRRDFAEQANFLCTCDDRFLKKARSLDTKPTKIVSPLEFVSELQT